MLSFKYLNQNMTFPHKKLAYLRLNIILFQSCLKFKFQVHNAAKAVSPDSYEQHYGNTKTISRKNASLISKTFIWWVYIYRRLT